MKKLIVLFVTINTLIACEPTYLEASLDSDESVTSVSLSASTGNVQLSDFEIISYLPYWGYINDSISTTNYDKYHYGDISTLFILASIAQDKDTVPNNPQRAIPKLIYGYTESHSSNQVNFGDMIAYIRNHSPNLKILLSLSDLHSNATERAETAELVNNVNRDSTISWLMEHYVDEYNLEGIDIDFEDDTLDPGYMGPYYSDFIKDLAGALHDTTARARRKLCVATLNGGDYTRSIITTDFKNSIDMLDIMTYSMDKMDNLRYNQYRNMINDFNNWTGIGVEASKITFGIPLWSEIADPYRPYGTQYPASGVLYGMGWVEQLKEDPSAMYRAYLTSSYNTPDSLPASYEQRYNGLYEIRRKAEWVKSKNARGVMAWDISRDPNVNDTGLREYSYLLKLMDWRTNPSNYLPIVAYAQQDYYANTQTIDGGFHSLIADPDNWVGVYEFDITQPYNIGASTGYYQYLSNTSSGNFSIPAWVTNNLTSNKLYILRFSNGPNGIGNSVLGTSHPFYKL